VTKQTVRQSWTGNNHQKLVLFCLLSDLTVGLICQLMAEIISERN